MQGDELVTRREYIEAWMRRQGLDGQPVRKFIVLRNWCEIVDVDRTYQVQVPPLPSTGLEGKTLYVIAQADSPALSAARVVEDRGEAGLFVEPIDNSNVQFLIPRDDVRILAIPLHPLAIRRRDLRLFIGDDAANKWDAARRNRRKVEQSDEA